MPYAKPQLLIDIFHLPKRAGKKQKPGSRPNNAKSGRSNIRTTPKGPTHKRQPLTLEARKERRQTQHKEKLDRAKSLGLCRHCGEPATGGQTRCVQCAERHRARRREDDSRRRAAAKLSEERPTQEPVAPASQEATAPQPDQQAPYRKATPASQASTPTYRTEGERPRGQHTERKKTRGEYEERATREAQGVRSMQGLQGERDTRTDPLRDMRRETQGGAPTEQRREEKKGYCRGPRRRRNPVRRRSTRSATSARSTAVWRCRTLRPEFLTTGHAGIICRHGDQIE